jgi:two-component system response regulator (stage 0 sporulation protein F)
VNGHIHRARTAPARILLAEDDSALRELLATAFREDGFDVVEASDGRALLDCLAEALSIDGNLEAFDVIVSDIRMPVYTALDIMDGVRTVLSNSKVILTTAFGDKSTHERAAQLGAAAVFDKPFDIDELRLAVYDLVYRSRQEQEAV